MAKAETQPEVVKATIDPKTKDYIARAKKAREQRKLAPMTVTSSVLEIPQKEIIGRFAKPTGGQDARFHYMFGDREKSDTYADRGYEPVLHQGEHYVHDGDPLWRLPMDLYRQDTDAVVARSNRVLKTRRTETPDAPGDAQTQLTTEVKVTDLDGNVQLDTTSTPG